MNEATLEKYKQLKIVWLFVLIVWAGFSYGQTSLPVSRTAWNSTPTGWTDASGGSYLTTFACSGNNGGRFDATNQTYLVNFTGSPDQLTFVVKSNATTTSTLLVEESADNISYTTVVSLNGTANLPTTCTTKGPYTLNSASRYVRWTFTKGTSNMTFDDVNISASVSVPMSLWFVEKNQRTRNGGLWSWSA